MGSPVDFQRYEVQLAHGATLAFDVEALNKDDGIVPQVAVRIVGKGNEFNISLNSAINTTDELRRIGQQFHQMANYIDEWNAERNEDFYED